MTTFAEAIATIEQAISHTMPDERVPLVLAHGRVLAESIVASETIPPAANSAMDGYAVLAADVASATLETPTLLRVVGESAAGRPFGGVASPGAAVRISTGALVPDGADAVVEVEATEERDGHVLVRRSVSPGASIREPGDDLRTGETVLHAGRRLTAGDIGVLASLGVTNVPVRVQPKVGILSTGDELVDPARTPAAGQIRNSSGPALYAAALAAGAEPVNIGIVGDDEDRLREWLELGLRYDILVTTGGVSAGQHDLVQHLLPELGVEVLFHRVEIKPGRPIMFGVLRESASETLVFGLPGNPVSSLLGFELFVAPAIARMMGARHDRLTLRARLTEPLTKRDAKRHFVRGILSSDDAGELVVCTTGNQSSGALTSMSRANCLIIRPEHATDTPAGDVVEVFVLGT